MSLSRRAMFGLTSGTLGGAVSRFLITPAEASSSILNLTARSPIDGTESVALATAGANWKATLANIFTSNVTTITSYSPTLTPNGGSISYTVVGAEYINIGKIYFIQVLFDITTDNGTGDLVFTLPVTAGADCTGVGFDATSSTSGSIRVQNGGTTAACRRYDGSYPTPGGGGATFYIGQISLISQ